MRILVLNAGSSSVKFALFDVNREERIAEGAAEEIGSIRFVSLFLRHQDDPSAVG